MRIQTLTFTLLLAGAGPFGLGAARAADTPAAGAVEACKADVEKLCPGVQPGEGRIAACLKGKHRQLSDGCKAAIKEQRRNRGKAAA